MFIGVLVIFLWKLETFVKALIKLPFSVQTKQYCSYSYSATIHSRWEAGPKEIDGLWAPWWYKTVHKSTGFEKPRKYPEVFGCFYHVLLVFYGESMMLFCLSYY